MEARIVEWIEMEAHPGRYHYRIQYQSGVDKWVDDQSPDINQAMILSLLRDFNRVYSNLTPRLSDEKSPELQIRRRIDQLDHELLMNGDDDDELSLMNDAHIEHRTIITGETSPYYPVRKERTKIENKQLKLEIELEKMITIKKEDVSLMGDIVNEWNNAPIGHQDVIGDSRMSEEDDDDDNRLASDLEMNDDNAASDDDIDRRQVDSVGISRPRRNRRAPLYLAESRVKEEIVDDADEDEDEDDVQIEDDVELVVDPIEESTSRQERRPAPSSRQSHQCPHCDYSTVVSSNLTVHMRRHTGNKPFSCSHCDYSTGVSSNLTVHMRRHTGEKPFSCSQCDYSTGVRSNLADHLRRHTSVKSSSRSASTAT